MATRKTGLGRGLDALLGPVNSPQPETGKEPGAEIVSANVVASGTAPAGVQTLSLERLQPGAYQPRRDMDGEALEELAASIRSQGVLQPIVVRKVADDRFEIIAGERRWRATQLAGLDKIPALVRDVPDEAAIAMALIEDGPNRMGETLSFPLDGGKVVEATIVSPVFLDAEGKRQNV